MESEPEVSFRVTKNEFKLLLASLLQSHSIFTNLEFYLEHTAFLHASESKRLALAMEMQKLLDKLAPDHGLEKIADEILDQMRKDN